MPRKLSESRATRLHRLALERLRRDHRARHDYVRDRLRTGLSSRFDAWDAEPPGVTNPEPDTDGTPE